MGLRLVSLIQGILGESIQVQKKKKKQNKDLSLSIESEVIFESQFVGFEVYCIIIIINMK